MSYHAITQARSFRGFGAATVPFDAVAVWADWDAQTNASTKRAALALQTALSELGYGPLTVDGSWGPKSIAAYNAFSAAQGTTSNSGYPTQDGIAKIGMLLTAGTPVGPNQAVTYTTTADGVVIPVSAGGANKAAISTPVMIAGGVAIALLLGGLVLAGKKKPEHHEEHKA